MIRTSTKLLNPFLRKTGLNYLSSIDYTEVKHFDQYRQEWWDERDGPMKGLHTMNDVRIPFIRTGLINVSVLSENAARKHNWLSGLKILDVGCGGGILSFPLFRLGGDVTGLDPSSNLIDCAERYAKDNKVTSCGSLRFVCTTIEEHSILNPTLYDVIVTSEVLEHVTNKKEFLKACVAALKPGGSLFVTTIAKSVESWLHTIILAEYILKLLPKGTHQWNKFICSHDTKEMLDEIGCSTILVNGLVYNPLNNVWHWTESTSISYALHALKGQKHTNKHAYSILSFSHNID